MERTFFNTKRAGAAFLLTDLDVGMTFLDLATTSTNPQTRQRNRENAQKAYDAVLHFLPRVIFTEAETKAVHEKLELLRNRLEAIGK
jgi:hypothetical protein